MPVPIGIGSSLARQPAVTVFVLPSSRLEDQERSIRRTAAKRHRRAQLNASLPSARKQVPAVRVHRRVLAIHAYLVG